MTLLRQAPEDFSQTAREAFDVLSQFTFFPGPLLLTQLRKHAFDHSTFSKNELRLVLNDIVVGVERFTSPAKAEAAREDLMIIIEGDAARLGND